MKTDDKNIEHILRGLADYRPPAKPDWDSFYDKNKKDINASAGSLAKSGLRRLSSVVSTRNILISLGFVIGIFAGFYFFTDTSSDLQIEDNSPIINNNNVENTFTIKPTENTRVINNEPKTISEPDQDLINNKSKEIRVIGVEGEIEEIKEIGEIEETGTDIKTEEPVIIKKTVIIRDTIRVTRPDKKVK